MLGLQNQPMKSLYNPGEDRSAEEGQKRDLGSVSMDASPNQGLFGSVQNMGTKNSGPGQGGEGEKQNPIQKYGGFMRKLRQTYDWAPKLGIANKYGGGEPQQGPQQGMRPPSAPMIGGMFNR